MHEAVTRDIAQPRERVWQVLADGWSYALWVVGASRIRAVEKDWPAPGSRILHSVGVWPLLLDDETTVVGSVRDERLELATRARPVGEARVTLRLSDIPGGCRVEMEEVAVAGPARLVPRRLQFAALMFRNRECLTRLGLLAGKPDPVTADS